MIGIFGGTFDPIHEGHLHLLRTALQAFDFSKVLVIPTGQNPHKRERTGARGKDRMEMLRLGLLDLADARLVASDLEIKRNGPSYTIETLQEVKQTEKESLVLILGNEVFESLPRWKDPHRVLELASCCVARRHNDVATDYATLLQLIGFHSLSKRPDKPGRIYYQSDQWIQEVSLKPLPVSATAIRRSMVQASTERPTGLTPPVWKYIKENHLYSVS